MTKRFQIPEPFLLGFYEISKYDLKIAKEIGEILKDTIAGTTAKDICDLLKNGKIPGDIEAVSRTIFSLGSLFVNEAGYDINLLAENLSSSFINDKKKEWKDISKDQLKANLLIIIKNAEAIKETYKAFQLLTENKNVHQKSRILSDIRLLFNEDIEKQQQTGLIIHQLKFEYLKDGNIKSFYISLDLEDLNELKSTIQRAIIKEESIKKNQAHINFITIK